MADLVITAASVVPGAGGTPSKGIAGAAITAGQPLYQSATDQSLNPALAGDLVGKAVCVGVAVNNAAAGQPVNYMPTGNTINLGAVLTVGESYVVSHNSGKIAPIADLVTGDWVTHLGVATTTSLLPLNVVVSNVQHA